MPLLFALLRSWPRLAFVGVLLLWLSPVALAAAIHDVVGRAIGAIPRASRARWLGGAASWWAGFVAWATILVVTISMALVAAVVEPPPILDPEYVRNFIAAVTNGGAGAARSVTWILLAAYVYELELRARTPVLSA